MSPARTTGHLLATSAIAAITLWIALLAWRPFIVGPSDYLGPVALIAAALALTGALLRAARSPAVVTLVIQAGVLTAALCGAIAGSYVPDGENLAAVDAALDAALGAAQNYAAPIGAEAPPVAPLLILGGGLLVLLMDFVACGLRRVPLSGLVLLAVYAVPAGVPTEGSTWFSFLAAAVGFLALLHLDARERMQRWGRAVGPNDSNEWSGVNPLGEALRAGAGRIGAVAIAAALAAPLLVPVFDLGLFGPAGGGGDGDIRIEKPVADMRRDLQRAADRPLITVTTDDPQPAYLRVAVLQRFNGAAWSSGDRDVNSSNQADGALPAPVGVDPDVPRRTYDYEVEVSDDFASTWLPTQFPAARVSAEGDWRFDPGSMDFLASEGQTTAGIEYTMTSIDHDFGNDGSRFLDAAVGEVDARFLALPDDVPTSVAAWAVRVTRGAMSDHERAVRLQRWFRSEFTYSLERAPAGTGNDTLQAFLAPEGRVGYCEQFASAMAVMARELGIPARVAVGFLRPERNDDNTWTYSSHDLHAWPELYFNGTGWVRFEPTPAGRAVATPSYSSPATDSGGQDDGLGGSPTDRPAGAGDANSVAPTSAPRDPRPSATADAPVEEDRGATPWVLAGVALVGLVALAAVGPGWLRRRQREHRRAGGSEQAWDELWATTVDLGLPWPKGRSPRETGAVLRSRLDDAEAAEALARLVQAVDEARYAPPERRGALGTADAEALATDVATCAAALTRGVGRGARVRARWVPQSVLRRPPRGGAVRDREPVPLGG